MEYVIGAVVLAVVVYLLTRKKKEKPPIEPPIEKQEEEQKEDKKEVIVKPLSTEQKVYWFKDGKKEWGIAKNMPQGLQVFDEQGNCTLDITDRITKYCGSVEVNGTSGSLTNEILREGELWYVFKDIVRPQGKQALKNIVYIGPVVEKKGNVLTWTYSNKPEQCLRGTILYGVY